MDKRLLVVALSYQEGSRWCNDKQIPLSNSLVLSTNSLDFYRQLQGRRDTEHVTVARWAHGMFALDLLDFLARAGSTEINERDIDAYKIKR
jgi:hypothetical protein